MRPTGQVRKELSLHAPQNADSIYKVKRKIYLCSISIINTVQQPIERKERRFNPLKIPKTLQAELPFANKPKQQTKAKKKSYLSKRAVVLEPEEKKVYTLMQQLNTLRNEKTRKRKLKDNERRENLEKKKAKLEKANELKEKERRKEYFRKEQQKKK